MLGIKRCNRKASCRLVAVLLAGLALVGCQRAEQPFDGERPPNIILMLVDDLRWDEPGYAGNPVATVNIDELARQGVRFDNAYVTSSLCSPSRASFLTGMYPHAHEVTGNLSDIDPELTPTIGMLLQEHGYRTAMIGKWHMGADARPRAGFDEWFALPGQGVYENPDFNANGKRLKSKGYNTDILTDRAIEFIEEHDDEPFYLHLSYKAVHQPLMPAPRHARTLQAADFRGLDRPNVTERKHSVRARRAETLLAVDDSVGRIMRYLEDAQLKDNTIVVFTSDNGYLLGEHGRADKRLFYEESIRIPWIVYYPPLGKAGTVRPEPILNIDFLPSVLELAGLPVPAHIQGRSFAPLLTGGSEDWRAYWVYEYFNEAEFMHLPTHLAVVDDRYKYVTFPEGADLFKEFSGEDMLFDLQVDPYEQHDLAASGDHSDILVAMKTQLRQFARETELRFFDLDPVFVNKRIKWLMDEEEGLGWFRAGMQRTYPQGYPGWEPPERKSFD